MAEPSLRFLRGRIHAIQRFDNVRHAPRGMHPTVIDIGKIDRVDPIFQESDPVYEGVKVPVEFYKIVVVVDDAKGQLSVTAFQMDQSAVMPPQPGAPRPKAPFDPGRFSVDQVTLSELEERSGLDFGKLKDFDVLAAQPVPKSLLRGARLRLPLTGVREAVLWAP
jgi:hypothetical protein